MNSQRLHFAGYFLFSFEETFLYFFLLNSLFNPFINTSYEETIHLNILILLNCFQQYVCVPYYMTIICSSQPHTKMYSHFEYSSPFSLTLSLSNTKPQNLLASCTSSYSSSWVNQFNFGYNFLGQKFVYSILPHTM